MISFTRKRGLPKLTEAAPHVYKIKVGRRKKSLWRIWHTFGKFQSHPRTVQLFLLWKSLIAHFSSCSQPVPREWYRDGQSYNTTATSFGY